MCGIFGVTLPKQPKITPDLLESASKDLFKLSESRGKEASGLALLGDKKIKVFKRPTSASHLISSKEFDKLFYDLKKEKPNSPLALIGHARLVTNGSLDGYYNNQPVIKDGVVGIHNGIVVNDQKIWTALPDLKRDYEVDTEVILSLVRMYLSQGLSLIEALKKSFTHIQGTASIALLFEDFDTLVLASNNGSLYLCFDEEKTAIIFASERYILDSLLKDKGLDKLLGKYQIKQVKAGSGYLIDLNTLNFDKFLLTGSGQAEDIRPAKDSREIVEINGQQKQPEIKSDQFDLDNFLASDLADLSHVHQAVDKLRRCTKCILPETMPFIEFDKDGVCNFCHHYQKYEVFGEEALQKEIAKYPSGRKGRPDCLVPLSGGRDSSYSLHYIKNVLKMNPVAFSYDWGMITDLARRNQARMCGQLGIEHILISADLNQKRKNIRKNVTAWLKKPDLGTVPLFMAGDKQYFYYINKLRKQMGTDLVFYAENYLEKTNFKSGFCGVKPKHQIFHVYDFALFDKVQLLFYYFKKYLSNPAYINMSLWDSFTAYLSSYFISHDYLYLYKYIRWEEEKINDTLIGQYDWELAEDTENSWRIGDGTAPFYNYIYYVVAGFTENDTFRSNQVREGVISRDKALELARRDNQPRYPSIKWYCDTIHIDFKDTLKRINQIPKLYQTNK